MSEALRKAVLANDPVAVAAALADPLVDPNCRFALPMGGEVTALHLAAMHGHDAALSVLLANDQVDRNAVTSRYQENSLHLAAFYGHLSTCKLLLPILSPHIRSKVKKFPYCLAKERVNRASTEEEKAKFRTIMEFLAEPTFIAGCHVGDLPMVKMTVEDGVDVNAENSAGLWGACLLLRVSVVDYLLKLGRLNVNAITPNTGDSILHQLTHPDCKSRAFVRVNENTLIDSRLYIGQKLIDNGANLNLRNNNRLTPLVTAIAINALDVVQLFVQNGADLTLKYSTVSYPDIESTALEIARGLKPDIYNYLKAEMISRGHQIDRTSDADYNKFFKFFLQTNPHAVKFCAPNNPLVLGLGK